MIWLLRDFDLLSVLLRACTLALELLTIGGISYLLVVALPSRAGEASLSACWRGIRWAALGLCLVELCYVAVDSAILMGSSSIPLSDLFAAPYFVAGVVAAVAALLIFLYATLTRVRGGGVRAGLVLAPLSLLVLLAIVSTSHSVSRLNDRLVLSVLTAAHHLGAAIWLGGLPFLLLSMRQAEQPEAAQRMLRRFSPLALTGAGALLLGGFGMAWFYLGVSENGSLAGLYGTAYGLMMVAKIYLVLLIMAMGAGNFFLVRRIETAPQALLTRLRRFGEVEIGFAFMAVLAAASMTSQPPAVDLPNDRVSLPEIIERFHPIEPRMTSPAFASAGAVNAARPGGEGDPVQRGERSERRQRRGVVGVQPSLVGIDRARRGLFCSDQQAAQGRMGAQLAAGLCRLGSVHRLAGRSRIAGLWGRDLSGPACMRRMFCSTVCMRY